MTSPALQQVEQYRRDLLRQMLEQCTPKQQSLFAKIWPRGIESIPEDKINSTIQLVERTLNKNKPAEGQETPNV